MTKTTKILLAVSVVSFLLSLTGMLNGQFLPVGAIFFGLFMIFHVLSKEAAKFDKEQDLRWAQAGYTSAAHVPRPTAGRPALSAVPTR